MPSPASPPNTPRAVVLLSGGLDSAVVLAIAQSRGFLCTALSFDYGQRHRTELLAASAVARRAGVLDHRTIHIDLRTIGGSSLTADIDVPKDRSPVELAGPIPITYVPARNLVFLSLATGLAEVVGAQDLFIGVNALDYSGYPDCRPPFIDSFARCAALATAAGVAGRPLKINAPLIEWSKARIITEGLRLGVDFALTHSCYDPAITPGESRPRACGHCDSCQLRRRGFLDAGAPDPTLYA